MSFLKKEVSAGWAYATLFIIAVALFAVPTAESFKQWGDESYELADFPTMTAEEARAEYEAIETEVAKGPGEALDYFALLGRIRALEKSCRKSMKSSLPLKDQHALIMMLTNPLTQEAHNKYVERYGGSTMSYVGMAYFQAHPDERGIGGPKKPTYGLLDLWGRTYLWSMLLAGVYFLLRLKRAGFNLLLEFVAGLKPLVASLAWPITLFRYPNDRLVQQQFASAMAYVGGLLSVLISFGGSASTVKAAESKETPKQQGYSLQIDGHHSELVGNGGPDPEEILRLNLGIPSGFYVEGLRINDRGTRVDILTAGAQIAKTTHGVVNAYAGQKMVVEKPGGSRTVLAGIQTFLSKGKFSFVLPVAQLERQVEPGPKTSLSILGQVTVRFAKKLYGGLEFWGKVSDDHSSGWYAGPVLGFSPTPAFIMEAGCFRNDAEETRCRARMMHTIRW